MQRQPLHDSLLLLDIENCVLERRTACRHDFRDVFARVVALCDLTPQDHVVLSAHPGLHAALFTIRSDWPTARLRPRAGADGADLALVSEVADLAQVVRSYRRVIIASGDHEFVGPVNRLRESSIHTVVIARPNHVSRDLRNACDEFISLTSPTNRDGTAGRPAAPIPPALYRAGRALPRRKRHSPQARAIHPRPH